MYFQSQKWYLFKAPKYKVEKVPFSIVKETHKKFIHNKHLYCLTSDITLLSEMINIVKQR